MDKQQRPYQSDLLQRSAASLRDNKHIIVQSPTGSGKSFIMSTTAARANSRGLTVLVLSETKKIFDQLVIECKAEKVDSTTKHIYIHPGRTYVAMSQSMINRPFIISQLQALGSNLLTLVDECHIGTFNKLLDQLPEMRIGYSATPALRWAKHLTTYYRALVPGPQVAELIQQGYLCSYKHFKRVSARLADLTKSNGEYTESSQEKVFSSETVYRDIIADLRTIPHKKCLIFTSSIKQCNALADRLAAEGFAVSRYHSKTTDGAYQLAQFTDLHHTNICVSVAALTKGWDYKPIDLILLARATTSMPLYFQMLGRASRVMDSPYRKTQFTCIDYGGNCDRHGFYYSDQDWSKLWQNKGKVGEGVAPVKTCPPPCLYMMPASALVCPNCGHVFPRTEKQKSVEETKLIEATEKYSNLIGRKLSTLSPEELAIYAKIQNKKTFGARIAKAHEQEEPGWIARYGRAMGYAPGWASFQSGLIPSEKIEYADFTLR